MLNQHGDLAVAIVAFYGVGLPIAIYVCIRHGFQRQLGWFYLVFLPILRIVGSILYIAGENVSSDKVALFTAAAILDSIGLVPLLMALMGLMNRVNNGIEPPPVSKTIFRIVHIPFLGGFVLAIVGGNFIIPTNTASKIAQGNNLRKAAAILLLVGYIAIVALTAVCFSHLRKVWRSDRILVYVGVASLPFLLVRMIYLLAVSFATSPSSVFYVFDLNIYVEAFMQITMEFIVFILYVVAGLMTAGLKETLQHTNGGGVFVDQQMKSGQMEGAEMGTISGSG